MASKDRQRLYRCPHCREQITRLPDNHTFYRCARCKARYRVMIDEETATPVFVDQARKSGAQPLGLPKGSIRALVSLAMAGAGAAVVYAGRDVPGPLASLLLTIIGFYFGFRTKASTLSDRVYDPTARRELPLYLPSGVIRTVLIVLCLAMAVMLHERQRLLSIETHLELFAILAGLVVGHYFKKVFRGARGGPALGHVKALLVLLMAGVLAWLFVSGRHVDLPDRLVTGLCATISFYFGSR